MKRIFANYTFKEGATTSITALMILLPTISVFSGNNAGAAIIGAVCAAALLLTRLPDIKSFELLGLKAQLEQTVSKAHATIDQIRDVAATLAEPVIIQTAMNGEFISSITMESKRELIASVEKSLSALGVPSAEIEKKTEVWRLMLSQRYLFHIAEYVKGRHPELIDAFEKLNNIPLAQRPIGQVRAICSAVSDRNLDDLVEDYEEAHSKGFIRRKGIIEKD